MPFGDPRGDEINKMAFVVKAYLYYIALFITGNNAHHKYLDMELMIYLENLFVMICILGEYIRRYLQRPAWWKGRCISVRSFLQDKRSFRLPVQIPGDG